MTKRIIITPGEPAGIGPDITIRIATESWPVELVVIADPDLLIARAKQLNIPLTLKIFSETDSKDIHQPGTLKIIPVKLASPCEAGILNSANATYVLKCLELATDLCARSIADALVTGPVHKGVINEANIPFTGHTEFLAQRLNAPQPIMLFVTPQTKVALATTHLPLSAVPKAITQEKLRSVLLTLHTELKKWFHLSNPRILVCGLNPHAGEQGNLGQEEITIIEPALQSLRAEGLTLIGPLPADTLFTEKQLTKGDAVLAMYHDQALPVVKFMSFGSAVNVTLGLPILRTSVDHGTALDAAGTLNADESSLREAIKLAIAMTK